VGILGWIILGLIAGAIAKAITGRHPGGLLVTLVVGVLGALLGGWLGSALFNAPLRNFWSLQTWLLAIGGSVILLLVWGAVTRRRA